MDNFRLGKNKADKKNWKQVKRFRYLNRVSRFLHLCFMVGAVLVIFCCAVFGAWVFYQKANGLQMSSLPLALRLVGVGFMFSSVLIFFSILGEKIFRFLWKCPSCGQPFAYYEQGKRREYLINEECKLTLDAKHIYALRPKQSNLIISEQCPYCGVCFFHSQ